MSGEAVIDFVSKACSKSAFYLDVLELHGNEKLRRLFYLFVERARVLTWKARMTTTTGA
ncbi:hypothetical protein YC2023_048216 [Brassica napus]